MSVLLFPGENSVQEDEPCSGHERFRKAIIIYNPISSKGNSGLVSEHIGDALEAAGLEVDRVESKPSAEEYRNAGIREQLASSDLAIIVGGDGTLSGLLPFLAETGTPVYMAPTGNESLFAQEHQMEREGERVLLAIHSSQVCERYFGTITDGSSTSVAFYSMASMGLDSLTIAAIGARRGPMNNFIYAAYGFRALARLHHPVISLWVDDQPVLSERQGYLIVANSPAYARGLALCAHADASRPSFVIGFLENAGFRAEWHKALRMARKRPADLRQMRYYEGQQVELMLHHPNYPLQADGEYFRHAPLETGVKIRFRVHDRPIRVLPGTLTFDLES